MHSRRVLVSYKRNSIYEVHRLFMYSQEKSVVRRTDHLNMTIAVDQDVKLQSKPKQLKQTTNLVIYILIFSENKA